MPNVVLFQQGAQLPAYMQNRDALKERSAINADIITGPTYPVLSIKGKVFTLVKGNDKKVLTRDDDPDAALQFINLTVVRANVKSRVFFAKAYVEGSEGVEARPDCYSVDGIVPAPDAQDRQAPKCAVCPHAVWGSRANMEGKGTACSVNTRAAVIDPNTVVAGEKLEPYLLRVPAGSRTNLSDVVKAAEQRNIPYNALVLKVGFDNEAPAPKLTFKLIGLLDDAVYAAVSEAYNDQTVEDMLGYRFHEAPPASAASSEAAADADRLLAEKRAREEVEAAAAQEAAAAAERARQAAAAQPAARAAPAADLSGLDAMMGGAAPTPAPAAQTAAVAPAAPAAEAAPTPRRRRTRAEMEAARAAAAATTQATAAPAPAAQVAQPAAQPVQQAAPVQASATPAADNSDLLNNLDALLAATDD